MVSLRGCLSPTLAGMSDGAMPRHGGFDPLTDYDWYVSGSGDDGNDGTTHATAFATPEAAAAVAQAGDTIAFERGNTYRGRFNSSADNLTLLAYGSGTLPVITAFDVYAGAWAKDGGTTNVWQASVTPETDATPNRRIFARKNGTPMEMRTSVAAVDSSPPINDNPGGCYAPDLDGVTGTYTVSVYATSDPGSDGQTYEMTVRENAVNLTGADNCTVRNLRLVGGTSKDGPLSAGDNTTVEDCVLEDGRWHNCVLSSGAVRRTDFLHMENGSLAAGAMCTFFRGTITTETYEISDCYFMLKFDPTDGYDRASGKTMYHHSSGSDRYATGTVQRCVAVWMPDGFHAVGADIVTITDCVTRQLKKTSGLSVHFIVNAAADQVFLNNCRAYAGETGYHGESLSVDHNGPVDDYLECNDCIFDGNSTSGHVVQVRGDCRFRNCLLHHESFHAIRDNGLGAANLTLDNCIIDGATQKIIRLQHAGSTLVASDNNQVDDSSLNWEYEGTDHADLAAQQANGYDANSVASDPSYTASYGDEPIANWTADGAKGPDTSGYADYATELDPATILADIQAK